MPAEKVGFMGKGRISESPIVLGVIHITRKILILVLLETSFAEHATGIPRIEDPVDQGLGHGPAGYATSAKERPRAAASVASILLG